MMKLVKIKDNINLKQLEELGFREIKENDFANPGCANCYILEDGIVGIKIDKKTRRIEICLYNEDYLYDDVSDIDLAKIFYNLIKRGLVEGGKERC